jgi:hypothetical protein
MPTAAATMAPTAPLGKTGAGSKNHRKKRDLNGAHMETPQHILF